ncbi:unnamed protein product [Prorocentrum cordatum]|uniref:Uncharacterized protein n=1 Tax=Prorocentrum cordatum TaxID=2364126 RepID=A0ABN9SRB3_9DINO|nr:unnamed protein product [Polarella glacialis]
MCCTRVGEPVGGATGCLRRKGQRRKVCGEVRAASPSRAGLVACFCGSWPGISRLRREVHRRAPTASLQAHSSAPPFLIFFLLLLLLLNLSVGALPLQGALNSNGAAAPLARRVLLLQPLASGTAVFGKEPPGVAWLAWRAMAWPRLVFGAAPK